jgi:transcriptional regulator with XRE-family HTH domain
MNTSIGAKIKKLRELKNYTQSYMAERLGLSMSGYGKIERDETEITLQRLQEIAEILETNYNTILSFDEKHIFNFTNNQSANGIVQNQQITKNEGWRELVSQLRNENVYLREIIKELSSKPQK